MVFQAFSKKVSEQFIVLKTAVTCINRDPCNRLALELEA
jgi:hypothetical protein